VVLGILIGLPSDLVPTVQTHFIVSAPVALIVGIPIFLVLKASKNIGLSYGACGITGMVVAAIPLAFLLVPEMQRSGGFTGGLTWQLVGYAVAVLASGVIGGLAFRWLAELLGEWCQVSILFT
jgi:hypothetical protein